MLPTSLFKANNTQELITANIYMLTVVTSYFIKCTSHVEINFNNTQSPVKLIFVVLHIM